MPSPLDMLSSTNDSMLSSLRSTGQSDFMSVLTKSDD